VGGDLDDQAGTRVGTVISNKYRLERLIGVGGMAAVYEAGHLRNRNRVAIKMLHAHLSVNGDLRARFLREGYVANTVDHRGAVRVLDDDTTEDGAVCLVMELLDGETVDARWETANHRMPPREVCELTYQLLDVLAAAHDKGIIHRDIKPENLFVTKDGVLKVLDFGIARLRETGGPEGHTRTGRMMGTPAFMPPEQALGRSRQIDGRTDLWAVGATMFTLVSGRFVHDADTMEAMLVYAGSQPARSIRTVAPELHPAIVAVIDRALAFSQDQRWASAGAMEAALGAGYAHAFGAPMPGARPSRKSYDAGAFSQTAAAPEPPVNSGPALAATNPRQLPTGLSTTAGIASHTPGVVAPSPRNKAAPATLAVIALSAVALLGGGTFVVARTVRGGSAPVGSGSAGAATQSPASASSPTPSVTASGDAVDPTQLSNADASTATPAAPSAIAPKARAPLPSSRPSAKPGAATPRAPAPNCDVPFYVDSAGVRRIRPECR
jgi:serine/threonine-protein kinase